MKAICPICGKELELSEQDEKAYRECLDPEGVEEPIEDLMCERCAWDDEMDVTRDWR